MRLILAALAVLAINAACGGDDASPSTSGSPSSSVSSSAYLTATHSPTPTAILTESPPPTAPPTNTPAPTKRPSQTTPSGFPIDPNTHLGIVTGAVGSRQLIFDGSGPTAYDYALNDQPSDDPNRANRSGWDCATHYEYEGASAEDFYIPDGTPIIATMDGTTTLNVISTVNDFDRYGVSREPYIGNPDRSRALYSPFPGPSSGMGVYVHLENTDYVTEYGHFDIDKTVSTVPASALLKGYSPTSDYNTIFAGAPEPRVITPIAQWYVHKGDVIGLSGDSGYSEGPHVHYTVAHAGASTRCPTTEAGFSDGGSLFR
jgi:hypothetical protein